ncbi:hypothetical protein WJX74_010665 [Apatococcus lobatus]|uniref:Uncharacterized protein n=1 Tax=Apatococcus lobatus TaxID=904363 RepID=A0AAW1Q8H3_9CHLO
MAELGSKSEKEATARACLLLLCGLPASGKSTLSRALQDFCSQQEQHTRCQVLSTDNAQAELSGGEDFNAKLWKAARRGVLQQTECLLRTAFGAATHTRLLLIVDDNMQYRSMRREFFQVARDARSAFVQLYISLPVELALKRNGQRTLQTRVPDAVIHRMAATLELPGAPGSRAAWDAAAAIHIKAEDLEGKSEADLGAIAWRAVTAKWGHAPPLPPTADDARAGARSSAAASDKHQLDLACRRAISETMKTAEGHGASGQLALRLNAHRKQLLERHNESATLPMNQLHICRSPEKGRSCVSSIKGITYA